MTLLREIDLTRGQPSVLSRVWFSRALDAVAPLDSINGYGLFRVMTTERPEIVVEASADGTSWKEWEFRWKAGDLKRRPSFVRADMPRLRLADVVARRSIRAARSGGCAADSAAARRRRGGGAPAGGRNRSAGARYASGCLATSTNFTFTRRTGRRRARVKRERLGDLDECESVGETAA
jgi:hypothetical protein